MAKRKASEIIRSQMGKKDKDAVLDDLEKAKSEIIQEKVKEIFRKHPKEHISKLEELGFTYFEDDEDSEEIEELNARPENRRQRDLVAYFEGKRDYRKRYSKVSARKRMPKVPTIPSSGNTSRQPTKILNPSSCTGWTITPAESISSMTCHISMSSKTS
jgi:hypothetical protein